MGKIYAYNYNGKIYINLTNRCSNNCGFCIRNNGSGVGDGGDLWLASEPTAAEVLDSLAGMDVAGSPEIVFCGYGEPIYRLEVIKEVGAALRKAGKTVRLNTNGQGNLIYGRDITAELADAVDIMSISMNNSTAEKYQETCISEFGLDAFPGVLEFARLSVPRFSRTILTVVDVIPPEEIEECRKICADIGCEFRVRHYES